MLKLWLRPGTTCTLPLGEMLPPGPADASIDRGATAPPFRPFDTAAQKLASS